MPGPRGIIQSMETWSAPSILRSTQQPLRPKYKAALSSRTSPWLLGHRASPHRTGQFYIRAVRQLQGWISSLASVDRHVHQRNSYRACTIMHSKYLGHRQRQYMDRPIKRFGLIRPSPLFNHLFFFTTGESKPTHSSDPRGLFPSPVPYTWPKTIPLKESFLFG